MIATRCRTGARTVKATTGRSKSGEGRIRPRCVRIRPARHTDVVIAGGSHAGLALAAGAGPYARAGASHRRHRAQPTCDGDAAAPADARAFAISAGSRNLLAAIGVWPELAASAEPVHAIDITDSSLEHAIRPVLLSYDNHVGDGAAGDLIVESEALRRSAAGRGAAGAGHHPARAYVFARFESTGAGVTVELSDGRTLRAQLLIAADGAQITSPTGRGHPHPRLEHGTGRHRHHRYP